MNAQDLQDIIDDPEEKAAELLEELEAHTEELQNELEQLKLVKQNKAEELFLAIVPKLDQYIGDVTELVDNLDEDVQPLIETVDEIQESLTILEKKVDKVAKQAGPPGKAGRNGETPIKGVDYFDGKTPTKKELVSLIEPLIPDPIPGRPGKDAAPLKMEDVVKDLKEQLKPTVYELVGNLHPGGNANRNIQASGVNVLRPFTDINFIAGANVSFSIAPNQQTKYTDWTINATGGSGSGITRLIQSVAVDTTAGAAPTIDYVYLVSGTTTITLPTAVGNSNLYTIKNVGSGTITIATTAAQTIDGSSSIILPVRYTSVDIESDTVNWNVT